MTEKLSMKKLSSDLETVRRRMRDLEHKLEGVLSSAASRLKRRSGSEDVFNVTAQRSGVSPEFREALIAKVAYFRAERRGFRNGSPEQDWFEARAEVDRLLMDDAIPGELADLAAKAAGGAETSAAGVDKSGSSASDSSP